ncbi:MAG: ABC transporter permease, partial [Lachnospiraceae bacterium]|nr:ABC transporter permease [Lachnospiraceae bacterium]
GEDEHYVIDKKTTYHFVNELLKSTGIPVEKVKNIHAYPENYRESFADYIVVQGLEERLEKPSIPVTEGRTFSEEEMKNGDNVIIINNSDRLAGMAGKMVGDSVIIDLVPYQVIGITSASENYITYANAVKTNTYRLMVGSVLFSRQLSPKQTKAWDKPLGACGIKAYINMSHQLSCCPEVRNNE